MLLLGSIIINIQSINTKNRYRAILDNEIGSVLYDMNINAHLSKGILDEMLREDIYTQEKILEFKRYYGDFYDSYKKMEEFRSSPDEERKRAGAYDYVFKFIIKIRHKVTKGDGELGDENLETIKEIQALLKKTIEEIYKEYKPNDGIHFEDEGWTCIYDRLLELNEGEYKSYLQRRVF